MAAQSHLDAGPGRSVAAEDHLFHRELVVGERTAGGLARDVGVGERDDAGRQSPPASALLDAAELTLDGRYDDVSAWFATYAKRGGRSTPISISASADVMEPVAVTV